MSTKFLTVKMDDGTEILLQGVELPGEEEDLAAAPRTIDFKKFAGNAVSQISKFALGIKESLQDAEPDEIELEVSLGITEALKPIIVSTEFSTGITVHLKWIGQKKA